ncbi:hypothetical protein [Azospirillum sp. sgz301742]
MRNGQAMDSSEPVGKQLGSADQLLEEERDSEGVRSQVPPMMRFLIPACRLVDLHDSRRTPGSDMASLPEARTGLEDGLYCTLAWVILEHLRECESKGAFEFVDLMPLARDRCVEFGVSPEDILWVALALATPTEIRWPGGSTRTTAPLKKLRRGHSYMLDRVGRELLAYVAGYFRWVHAGAEARKLITDLDSGDFASFREIAQRILTKIRSELFDLRQLKEQPEIDVLQQSFLAQADRFIKTFVEVSRVIAEAQGLLRTPVTVRKLRGWAEANDAEVEDVLGEANDTLTRLAGANALLHRLVADFVNEVQSRQRSLVGVVGFDRAIDTFLRAAPGVGTDPEFLERIMALTGPVSFPGLEFNPLELRHCVVRRVRSEPQPRQRIRRERVEPKLERVDAFVARNREAIMRMLATGPVSLSAFLQADEAETDGEIAIDPRDLDSLVEMATVFFSPYVLRLEDELKSKCLRFRVGGNTEWTLKDGWTLRGPELLMELVERTP